MGEASPILSNLEIVFRAAVIYLVGIGIVRLGKSRLISRATSLDIILGFILGSLLSRGITGHATLLSTIVASSTLVALHYGATELACKFDWFSELIKGHCRPLVEHGEINKKNMAHSHMSDGDLMESVRLNGVGSMDDVDFAYKERNGEISIIKKRPGASASPRPATIESKRERAWRGNGLTAD